MKNNKLVVIAPGHGGHDPGAVCDGWQEKDLTLMLSQQLGHVLQHDHGVPCLFARTMDAYIGLEERCRRAHQWGASVFFAIHANAFADERVRGLEIWTSKGVTRADKLADKLYDEFDEALPNEDDVHLRRDYFDGDADKERAPNQKDLYVLHHAEKFGIPAVLVEYEFMTNKEGLERLLDPSWRWQACRASAKALTSWLSEYQTKGLGQEVA